MRLRNDLIKSIEKDFDIYGYFFKKGKKRSIVEQLHTKANEYAKEISFTNGR